MRAIILVRILLPCVCCLFAQSSLLAGSTPLTATELHLVQLDEHGDLADFVRIDAPTDYEWTPLATIEAAKTEGIRRDRGAASPALSQAGTPLHGSDASAAETTTGWGGLEDLPYSPAESAEVTARSATEELTVVPEPSLMALALLGAGALVSTRRYLRRL